MPRIIWTIGHSTRAFDAFAGLLQTEGISLLADVRRFPGSTRYPHFNREALEAALPPLGIAYRHFGALGGRRGKPAPTPPTPAGGSRRSRRMPTSWTRPRFGTLWRT